MTAARTYGALELRGEHWRISHLEPHVSIRFKHLFPRVPKGSTGPFHLGRSLDIDADLLWFTARYPLAVSPADRDALKSGYLAFRSHQAEMERILLPSYETPAYGGLRPGQVIRNYQAQAIEIAARGKGLLLGDECGLGKTFTGAGFCLDSGRLPAAIVCQVHIQKQWKAVLETFTTLRVYAVKTTSPAKEKLPPADVYLFRYTQLAGWVDVFGQGFFKTAIYDEPQELRTGLSSGKGQAANILSTHTVHRMGLTATPIYNYGAEIFEIMRFINHGVLGDWPDFEREFISSATGKLRDPKAVGTYLREQYAFLRRTKADVGRELPPVNRIVDTVSHDEEAIRSIEALARRLAITATTGSFTERGEATRELDLRVRHATGVAKARAVAAVVRVLLDGGQPVLLMGWHRDVYDIWMKELGDFKPAMYTGSESPTQKAASKERFLGGDTDLLIMSLRSAAGLDGLQARCSWIVFGELDWSPGIHHQCIERLDRDGQTQPVSALFLVADDGSDPPMMEVLGIKASEARQVVDPNAGDMGAHTDQRPLKALVERYLHRRGGALLPLDHPEPAESVA